MVLAGLCVIIGMTLLSAVTILIASYGQRAKMLAQDSKGSRKGLDPAPRVVTVVFHPKQTGVILGREVRLGKDSRLRVAANVTKVLPNGNMEIEAKWTTTDGDQKKYQTLSGVVRPSVVGKVDGVVNGDEVADLRVNRLVVSEPDSQYSDTDVLPAINNANQTK